MKKTLASCHWEGGGWLGFWVDLIWRLLLNVSEILLALLCSRFRFHLQVEHVVAVVVLLHHMASERQQLSLFISVTSLRWSVCSWICLANWEGQVLTGPGLGSCTNLSLATLRGFPSNHQVQSSSQEWGVLVLGTRGSRGQVTEQEWECVKEEGATDAE